MEQCDLDTASRWRLEQRSAFFIGFSPLHGRMYAVHSISCHGTSLAQHHDQVSAVEGRVELQVVFAEKAQGRVFAVPTLRNLGPLASCNSDSRGDFKRLDFHSLSD